MKKLLTLLALAIFIVGCSSTGSGLETNDEQIARLLKEAERKEKEKKEMQAVAVEVTVDENIKEEEALENNEIQEVEEIKNVNPHEGKTRGEIMQYEMERVRAEMETLQTSVNEYAEKVKVLKEYKEKVEKLENLNKASMQ